ncbi:hypothetical protein CJU89_1306 [Yarrowia sp. B02]|nr:hypothetical protein CJU89_1306 [Yarrowia sp. B02]
MQFSAVLLAAAAGLVSAQQFNLVAIHSGSDVQNSPINSDGKQLVVGGSTGSTTYEVKDRGLYANGKPVSFGDYATIEETDGMATRDVIVNGQDHLYVPRFDFVACPKDNGYILANQEACKDGAIGIAVRAIYKDGESAAASSEAPKETAAAAGNGTVVTKTGVVTAKSTALVTITSCEDDKCHKPTGEPSKPAQATEPTTAPAQANGAAAFGVSVAAAGVAAAALLI